MTMVSLFPLKKLSAYARFASDTTNILFVGSGKGVWAHHDVSQVGSDMGEGPARSRVVGEPRL